MLSVCLIVKNEAAHLERCLASVAGLADDIVVVDTGSTDGTPELAQRLGARVFRVEWTHDFSAARNASLAQARGEWILVLDADEYLEPDAKEQIRELLWRHGVPALRAAVSYNLIQRSTSDGGRTGANAHLARLFPNRPDVRYRWPIHEQVVLSLRDAGLPIINTDIRILHTGYANADVSRAKQRRNLSILEAQIAAGHELSPLTWFLAGGAYLDLDEPGRALAAYACCVVTSRAGGGFAEIAAGAKVRRLECLLRLQRIEDVIAETPEVAETDTHPEAITFRAQALLSLGRVDEAMRCYAQVFRCTDRTWIPPCSVAHVKSEALRNLGQYWHARSHGARGVALLRAALALKTQGADVGPEDYERFVAA